MLKTGRSSQLKAKRHSIFSFIGGSDVGSVLSIDGNRLETGSEDPAMKPNFIFREVSTIFLAHFQFQERCLSLNNGAVRPLLR